MLYSVVTTGSALAAALSTIVISKEGFGLLIGTAQPIVVPLSLTDKSCCQIWFTVRRDTDQQHL